MKWSFKLGKIFGITIRVHYLFFLLVLALSLSAALKPGGGGIRDGLIVAGALLVVFSMVVLHELGHSLVARRYRVRVKDIILLPIGGMARMMDIPRQPGQELRIAVAGPLTSFVLAAVFFAIGWGFGLLGYDGYRFLVGINIALGVFNLLPAFPMDGGRILRSLLARRYDFMRATRIAVKVARAIAVAGVALGFYFDMIWFVILSLFVFWGAGAEEKATRISLGIGGRTAGEAMLARPLRLKTTTAVAELPLLMRGRLQDDFPVYAGRRLAGVLGGASLERALAGPASDPVYDYMEKRFFSVGPEQPLSVVYKHMLESKVSVVPVMEGTRLVGMLSPGIILRHGRLFSARKGS